VHGAQARAGGRLMLFGSDRAELRRIFAQAWARRVQGLPLESAQARIADVVAMHPEYHSLLADAQSLQRDFGPDESGGNPFLHMALHLSVREQYASDRPPGVAALLDALLRRTGDRHAADHEAMECLAQVLWEAQRAGTVPAEDRYLECLRLHVRRR
jgi:hypothetical protein